MFVHNVGVAGPDGAEHVVRAAPTITLSVVFSSI